MIIQQGDAQVEAPSTEGAQAITNDRSILVEQILFCGAQQMESRTDVAAA